MNLQKCFKYLPFILSCYASLAGAADDERSKLRSAHLGFVHPEGVDLAGYSVETKLGNNVYSFYTFGIPSIAALGLSYYEQYNGNGFFASAGAGIGFVLYGSVAYQWKIEQQHFFKLGAGLAAGVAYSGAIPVMSYEYRFDQ
jgi:hypothetical protein